MPRWQIALLALVPVAIVVRVLGGPPTVIFALSALGLVPLAALIGRATEELAHHLGPRFGGLLNATFGNAAELIITLFAIQRGLLTLVKASITGSIIGNTLLILGLSLLAGGWRHGRQRFDSREASVNAAMMLLAVSGLYLPATFAATAGAGADVEPLSLLVAGVMLLTYGAYIVQSVFQKQHAEPLVAVHVPAATPAVWSARKGLIVLAASTAGTAVVSEMLVGAVEPVTAQLGWSEFFVGVIIVPLVGNAAEHFSAVQFAWRNRLDVSIAIAAGSSTQVALLVGPLLVFLSLLMGNPMDLVFVPLELAILGLSAAVFAYISLDGESNWLEGFQLLGLYTIAAVVMFFVPTTAGH